MSDLGPLQEAIESLDKELTDAQRPLRAFSEKHTALLELVDQVKTVAAQALNEQYQDSAGLLPH